MKKEEEEEEERRRKRSHFCNQQIEGDERNIIENVSTLPALP